MSGMDLGGAFGAGGAVDGLQQLLAQRQAERVFQAEQAFKQQQLALEQQRLANETETKRATLAAMQEDRQAQADQRRGAAANTLGDQLPGGTFLPKTDPAVGILETGGRGSLLQHQDPTMASTQFSGFTTPHGSGPSLGVLNTSAAAAKPEGYLKLPSAKQQEDAAKLAPQPAAAQETEPVMRVNPRTGKLEQIGTAQKGAHFVTEPPPPAAKDAPRKRVEYVDPASGQTVVEYLTDAELKGRQFAPRQNATTENRITVAKTVDAIATNLISKLNDPTYQKVLGPALGRAGSVSNFIGNPPPEFSELAGEIQSYAAANMGLHGFRSASGAEKIKELLDQHHTPQSLIAAITGLNHFAQTYVANASPGGGPAAGVPTPPAAAPKRYNPATGKVE